MIYGFGTWGDLFTPRQALALSTLCRRVLEAGDCMASELADGLRAAVQAVLAIAVDRLADISNSLCRWKPTMSQAINLFGRQAIPMMWDFAETSPLSNAAGDMSVTVSNLIRVLEREAVQVTQGQAEQASAAAHPLPDHSAHAVITDPPYYDAVPYAYLSDFFYVWLRRCLAGIQPDLFQSKHVPKRH
jgi:adenine-specific DNA methylase